MLLPRCSGLTVGFVRSIDHFFCFQKSSDSLREIKSEASKAKLLDAIVMIQSRQINVPRSVVIQHKDIGFTGAVIGLGKKAKVVIPKAWLSFTTEELASSIARRAFAVGSGSYMQGLVFAFYWNAAGFLLCSVLPGAGFSNVSGLVTTVCGFALWSFIGLLTLPRVSRNASLKIDQALVHRGMPRKWISNTATSIDQLQDDEPERPRLIETLFLLFRVLMVAAITNVSLGFPRGMLPVQHFVSHGLVSGSCPDPIIVMSTDPNFGQCCQRIGPL